MKNSSARSIALSGVLAALAIVIMCLGGLIPLATYICPMLCALICFFVLRLCGRRIAWAWYAAVSLLCVLIGPDKEAALVFLFLGYYPIVKQWLDTKTLSLLWKALLFNGSVALIYLFQIFFLGIAFSVAEFGGIGLLWLLLLLLLGNTTFFLLDRLLNMLTRKY